MKKVIDMLGFKVNKFNEWLQKKNMKQIRGATGTKADVSALLKAPSDSSKSRRHLRVVK
jgi:hypothetical protein